MNSLVGKRVSVKRVVATVLRNMDIQDSSRMFHHFVEWAFEAEKKIGSYKTFVKKEITLPVANKQAAVPSDFLSLIDIKKTGDATNSSYLEQTSATFPSNVDRTHMFYLTEDTITFTGSDVTSVDVSYLAIDTDEDGYPTIADSHEDAVSAYLMWKYKSRDYWNGKLPRALFIDLQRNWSRLCAQARGNDNMPSPKEMKKAAQIWNTLVPIRSSNGLLNV